MTEFSIERPWAFFGLLLLVPAVIWGLVLYHKSVSHINSFYFSSKKQDRNRPEEFRIRIFWCCALRCLSWVMLVFAYAGISWGTISTPVQKTGHSIAMVFDISYSMTAKDAPSGLTRLEAASEYAKMLLPRISGNTVSAVIAKGDGVIEVPLTEDVNVLYSLFEMLSPSMMSSAGSSLGKGIEAGLKSFSSSVASAPVIWLFTDGDETDRGLLPALVSAVRSGTEVVIIGFGSERETEITAGDGETMVKTALRADRLEEIAEAVNKKNEVGRSVKFIKKAGVKYVDATDVGSAIAVLSSVNGKLPGKNKKINDADDDNYILAYEVQPVKRHEIFIILAILFFGASSVVSEFSPSKMKQKMLLSMAVIPMLFFTSCSESFSDAKKILESTWNWHQKKYDQAVAGFLQTVDSARARQDSDMEQYAIYGLSVTYLMQNEKDAAVERLKEISVTAPDTIRFAACYNAGILARLEGNFDLAVECFKQSLLINPMNVDAKINLELSMNQEERRVREGEQEITPASENQDDGSSVEKAVFNRIKENDRNQWKNHSSEQRNTSVLDY